MERLSALIAERFSDRNAETDDGFRAEVRSTSLLSLRTVGALEATVPLVMAAARLCIIPIAISNFTTALPNLAVSTLGFVTFGLAFTAVGRMWPRFWAAASIWSSVAIMIWSAILLTPDLGWVEHHILGYIVLVLFACASAVPFKPLHAFALGLAIDVLYLVSAQVARIQLGWRGEELGFAQHLFTLTVTLLCTGLTSSVYNQRHRGYIQHQNALRTSEMLRESDRRLLLAENAATMGRVAAALSHELNSPIGALSSSVQSLGRIAERMPTATPTEQQRLRKVASNLAETGKESSERLRGIIGRIQRFTNLDRAEVQSADLSSLIHDVVALVRAEHSGNVEVETDLQPELRFVCRPQQMSAVFSNLVNYALEGEGARVSVTGRQTPDRIEIRIDNNGRQLPPEEIAVLFDPAAFRVSQGRVAATNLGLFSSQQIVREHGGTIEASSSTERGTSIHLFLPTVRSIISS